MDAKELRIGNYIKARKTTTIDENVVLLDSMQFLDLIMSSNIQYFEPIPLTEQWLLDFGFVRVEGWDDQVYWRLKDSGFESFELFETCAGYELIGGKICKEVHTLQNCFYFHEFKELIKI